MFFFFFLKKRLNQTRLGVKFDFNMVEFETNTPILDVTSTPFNTTLIRKNVKGKPLIFVKLTLIFGRCLNDTFQMM